MPIEFLKKKECLSYPLHCLQLYGNQCGFCCFRPRSEKKIAKTYLSVNQYIDFFDKHGFRCVTAMNLLNATGVHIYPNYLDPESILDKNWQKATSLFDIASGTMIKKMESAVLDKKKDGTLESFVKENDHSHKRVLVTLFACIPKA